MKAQDDQRESANFIVSEDLAGYRLDLYLAHTEPRFSRSFHKGLITSDQVKVNGEVEYKPQYKVRPGDKIDIAFEPPVDNAEIKPEKIAIEVLYEDDNLLAISKPIGQVVHPGAGNPTGTLANAVKYYLAEKGEDKFGPDRAGQVHRLDKDTSGVILFSKSPESLWYLSKQFADRVVYKTYIAGVSGEAPMRFSENSPIGRDKINRQKFSSNTNKPRQAHTDFEQIASNSDYSLVRAKPTTGRTHQIRVHLAQNSLPIIGDRKYGGKRASRMLLHAYKIRFSPAPGRDKLEVTAPLPDDFLSVLDKLGLPPAILKDKHF